MILEHRFLCDVLQFIWKNHPEQKAPEVLRTDVDDSGYDLIIEWRGTLRHIQLKGTVDKRKDIRVNRSLAVKSSGCVVLMTCSNDLAEVSYSWLGGGSGERVDLNGEGSRSAKHLKADRTGTKKESISARWISRRLFKKIDHIGSLVAAMFPAQA